MAIWGTSGLEGIRAVMKEAAVIAVAIVIAGFLSGGRYAVSGADNSSAYRVDRWTGATTFCDVVGCRADQQ